MDKEFEVQVSYLQALLLFASKLDIRYYLNSLCVRNNKLIATNGHVLVIYNIGQDTGIDVIIPREEVEAAIALSKKKKAKFVKITPTTIGGINFKAIEGVYPDVGKVLPDKISEMKVECLGFNGRYLADFHKAARLVSGSDAIYLWQKNISTAAVVQFCHDERMFAIIMPLRAGHQEIPQIPAWLDDIRPSATVVASEAVE